MNNARNISTLGFVCVVLTMFSFAELLATGDCIMFIPISLSVIGMGLALDLLDKAN